MILCNRFVSRRLLNYHIMEGINNLWNIFNLFSYLWCSFLPALHLSLSVVCSISAKWYFLCAPTSKMWNEKKSEFTFHNFFWSFFFVHPDSNLKIFFFFFLCPTVRAYHIFYRIFAASKLKRHLVGKKTKTTDNFKLKLIKKLWTDREEKDFLNDRGG